MPMQFFYSPNSIALAAHIILDELGADYIANKVDFGKNEQRSAEYLAVNPKGRVPALVTEQGILTETPAILTYLAQTHPAAGLLPQDAWQAAQAQSVMAYLCATVHVAHAHKLRGARWTDDAAARAALTAYVPTSMRAACQLVEDELLRGPWVLGESYSVCDPYLFTIARWLEGDGVDIAALPRIAAHRQRMLARPAVARLMDGTYI